MKKCMLLLAVLAGIICLMPTQSATAANLGKMINFGNTKQFQGYYVAGRGTSKHPGIVMIHEWWGLNSNIKREADRFARNGYNVLAVDIFGGVAKTRAEAMEMVKNVKQNNATNQMMHAASFLRRLKGSNGKVGSLGWCFGGAQSLTLALNDKKLNAAVMYYGQPETNPLILAQIRAPLLGLFGEEDQSIPVTKVKEFDKALTEAGVTHEIHTYPKAAHAFANPTNTSAYNPEAALAANKRASDFLKKHLK